MCVGMVFTSWPKESSERVAKPTSSSRSLMGVVRGGGEEVRASIRGRSSETPGFNNDNYVVGSTNPECSRA